MAQATTKKGAFLGKTEKSEFKHYFDPAPKDLYFQDNFKYEIVRSKETLMSIKENVLALGLKTIAVDTETTGLDFVKDRIVGISFSFDAYSGYYIPIRHGVGINAEEGILDLFFDEFMAKDFTVLFFNAIFDMFMFILEGKDYEKVKFFDTHTLVFNADSQAPEKNLKFSAKHFLGRDPDNFESTLGGKATFDLIAPEDGVYYACHDKETEVLTDKGWIYWKDYDGVSSLATVNLQNSTFEYQKPSKFISYKYEGLMYTYKSANQDFKVTPNHRMIIHKGQNLKNPPILLPIESLKVEETLYNSYLSKVSTAPDTFTFDGIIIQAIDFVGLLGIIFSDGWVKTRTKTSRNYSIGIVVCKDTWRKPIMDLLDRTGLNYGVYKKGTNIVINNKDLWKYLKPYVGLGARTKHIPEIIKQMSPEVIKEFLLFYRYGDGSISNNGEQYYTTSKLMANDLHELFAILGYRAKMYIRKPKDVYIENRLVKKENCADLYFFTVPVNGRF